MRRVNLTLAHRILHWDAPPRVLGIASSEVHVWVADLDEISLVREFAPILSTDEAERAARFHFQRDRRNFIAARGLLRTLLAGYTKTDPATLQFNYSANGKPSLASSAQFGNLRFNLSHSDGVAVYAFAQNRELGIDVESLRPFADMEQIAARCFSAEQQIDFRSAQNTAQEEKFFRYWTRKEAVLKCSGEGFSDAGAEIGDVPFDGTVCELKPADGYIATLAVLGAPFTLRTCQFTP